MKGLLFHKWVQEKIAERNETLEKKADLMISMDPQIAAAFNKSTMISTSHGSGSQMLCAGSKRRRNRAEMQDAKEEEILRGEALDIK